MLRRFFLICVVLVELALVFTIATNAIVYFSARPYIFDSSANVPSAEAVVIPGASLTRTGKPAPIFTDRIDAAIELYHSGKVKKILVSGDDSTTGHNEVEAARAYLAQKGIPEADVFLDHAGFDTYSTMYRARDIFHVSSIIVTSQSFHLPRAIFLARHLGIEAYGVNADEGHILIENYIREAFANVKALLDLFFARAPKFLGAPIPITGSSTETQ